MIDDMGKQRGRPSNDSRMKAAAQAGDSELEESLFDMTAIRNRKEVARTKLIETQRAVLESRYVEREGIEDALCGLAMMVVHSMERLERALPAAVGGHTVEQSEIIVRDHLDAMRREIVGDLDIRMTKIDEVRSAVTAVRRKSPGGHSGKAYIDVSK